MDAGSFTDAEAFESLIRAALEKNGGGSFGRIHLVCVLPDSEASALGASLPKAIAMAERIIRRRLSADDACLPLEPGKYMLVFPGLTEAEGNVKAGAISREIKERLFGESGSGHFSVTVQMLPLERLRGRPIAPSPSAMETILDTHAHHTALALQVVFQPVWSVERQAIIGNRAVTRRVFQGQELLDDAVQLAGDQDPMARDRNVALRRAVALAHASEGMMIMPQALNDHTMTDLNRVTEEIRRLKAFCPGGLMVELSGGVAATAHTRLRDVIRSLRAGGAEVGARIVPEAAMARFLHDCGIGHLCFNEAQARQASFTHSALYALLAVVAHEVKGSGLGLCLWNASNGEDVKRAAALGFSMFSGLPFGANRPHPAQPAGRPSSSVFA